MSDIAERVLLPSAVVPVHYALELTPDLETFTFVGSEVVDVVVSSTTDKITVHAKHLKILKSVVFEAADGSMKLESFEIAYNSRLSTVSFTFPNSLPLGNGKFKVAFSGELNNQMAGFYRSKYYDIDGTELYMAATQFESLDARRCFPCWDEPARKATFSATLVVKSHLCALSNMPETSSTYLKNGLKRVTFDTTPIMSTYLLAFCVGKFDYLTTVTKHGVAMRVFTPPGMASKGEFALRVGREALDFYDDYFQIPYPLPKLDQSKRCRTYFMVYSSSVYVIS
jgi:aminopeptidase N